MIANVNINGFVTPIELPDTVRAGGDVQAYHIDYGGLVEIGGVVSVDAQPVRDGEIEGVALLPLGFSRVLSVSATAGNVKETAEHLTGESAFVELAGDTLKVFASARANEAKTIQVFWSAKLMR